VARLVLTTPTLADEDEFLAANAASRLYHRPWAYNPLTPDAYRTYVAALGDRKVGYLARRRSDRAIVGWINLSEIVRGNFHSAYLGYCGYAHSAGQGYMTEALELVLREAFITHRLHRVEANIQPGNAPSIALVRRLGFELEGLSPRYLKIGGRWRDHERYALRAETWRGHRG
jgi:[ribosomal protein S5]-alanine N-acetyltransferase